MKSISFRKALWQGTHTLSLRPLVFLRSLWPALLTSTTVSVLLLSWILYVYIPKAAAVPITEKVGILEQLHAGFAALEWRDFLLLAGAVLLWLLSEILLRTYGWKAHQATRAAAMPDSEAAHPSCHPHHLCAHLPVGIVHLPDCHPALSPCFMAWPLLAMDCAAGASSLALSRLGQCIPSHHLGTPLRRRAPQMPVAPSAVARQAHTHRYFQHHPAHIHGALALAAPDSVPARLLFRPVRTARSRPSQSYHWFPHSPSSILRHRHDAPDTTPHDLLALDLGTQYSKYHLMC